MQVCTPFQQPPHLPAFYPLALPQSLFTTSMTSHSTSMTVPQGHKLTWYAVHVRQLPKEAKKMSVLEPVSSYKFHVTASCQAFASAWLLGNKILTSVIHACQLWMGRCTRRSKRRQSPRSICVIDSPYTKHSTPYTTHHTPHTLQPTPYTRQVYTAIKATAVPPFPESSPPAKVPTVFMSSFLLLENYRAWS